MATRRDKPVESTGDTNESVAVATRPSRWPLYVMGGIALALGARLPIDQLLSRRNPDDRALEKVAYDYQLRRGVGDPETSDEKKELDKNGNVRGHVRGQQIGKPKPVKPTEESAKALAEEAKCFANQLGFPFAKDYTGKKARRAFEDGKEGEFFWSHDASGRQKKKFLWFPNLFGHLTEDRVNLIVGTADVLRHHPIEAARNSIKWLTKDYVAPLKPEGVSSKEENQAYAKKEREAFAEYIREFLHSRLTCPQWYDGSCMIDYQGRECLLLEKLAGAVTDANAVMYVQTKEQIQPVICSRPEKEQAVIAADMYQCDPNKVEAGANAPGESHHNTGLAFDLANSKRAKPFLADIGMACDFIGGVLSKSDPGHCAEFEQDESGAAHVLEHGIDSGLKELKKWK